MTNPAYVNWVMMVKGDEEKLVHPGNVVNHERFGWVRKLPAGAEAPVDDKAYQSLTLPELTEMVVEHAANEVEAPAEAEVPPAEQEPPSTEGFEVLTKPGSARKRRSKKDKS